MAIYTTYIPVAGGTHAIWESSNLKSTDIGNVWDVLVCKAGDDDKMTPIDADNAVAVKVGEYTGNGLQERYAEIAAVKDKVAVLGTPALLKSAFTKAQASPKNFYNVAGLDAKAYEVVDQDIFGVSLEGFADAALVNITDANVKKGLYVVVDGTGKWTVQTAEPSATAYGFIGKVHSLAPDMIEETTIVRVLCLQNVQL